MTRAERVLARKVAAAIVYDAVTGRIQHVHRHITLEGGLEPDRCQVEKRALEISLQRPGREVSRMKVLHISDEAMRPGKIYRVDVESVELVEIGTRPIPRTGRVRAVGQGETMFPLVVGELVEQ